MQHKLNTTQKKESQAIANTTQHSNKSNDSTGDNIYQRMADSSTQVQNAIQFQKAVDNSNQVQTQFSFSPVTQLCSQGGGGSTASETEGQKPERESIDRLKYEPKSIMRKAIAAPPFAPPNDNSNTIQKKEQPHRESFSQVMQRKEKPNNTGLPNQLKSNLESMSGYSMDDVKVHYNSSKPAQLQAHAYAQGSDIHIGPGQEKHLGHEAWHVVQQKQGRVKPTMQMKGIEVNINDDTGLEREADVMGAKALQMKQDSKESNIQSTQASYSNDASLPIQRAIWLAATHLDKEMGKTAYQENLPKLIGDKKDSEGNDVNINKEALEEMIQNDDSTSALEHDNSKRGSVVSRSLKEIGNRIQLDEKLYIHSHGDGATVAGVNAETLAEQLNAALGKDYVGEIVLVSCHAGEPMDESNYEDTYAQRLHTALLNFNRNNKVRAYTDAMLTIAPLIGGKRESKMVTLETLNSGRVMEGLDEKNMKIRANLDEYETEMKEWNNKPENENDKYNIEEELNEYKQQLEKEYDIAGYEESIEDARNRKKVTYEGGQRTFPSDENWNKFTKERFDAQKQEEEKKQEQNQQTDSVNEKKKTSSIHESKDEKKKKKKNKCTIF